MKEIRLCWVLTRTTTIDGEPIEYGPWCPDSETSRHGLQYFVDACVQAGGEGSHWIQEREVETL